MDEKKDFDRIFRKYYNELYCFAMQFMHDPDDARDIVHDAYEDVWRRFADMEEHSVRGYLYKNVRNKAIDLLRRIETRRNYAELAMKVSSPYDSSVDPLELQEREQIVEEVLNSLKPPTKEIFIWCYVDRKHYKEVAQRLGVSVSMVKKHISKALAIIREKREKLKI